MGSTKWPVDTAPPSHVGFDDMPKNIVAVSIRPHSTINEAAQNLDANRIGIVLVTDKSGKLVGTITDGDIRRAILEHIDFEQPISTLLLKKANFTPITARQTDDSRTLLKLLNDKSIRHLPIVDNSGKVVNLITTDDFAIDSSKQIEAVIMAGGTGTRLRPLTDETPKPMLPIGDKPLMEIIIQQLKEADIKKVNITLNHKPDKITEYFGNGTPFGVDIDYITEYKPLGTAGALKQIKSRNDTILIINGDILTQVDFNAMIDFHKSHDAELTVAVQNQVIQVPYGVVECDGINVITLKEKPQLEFFINAGIYLIEPSVIDVIPENMKFDMTDVISSLIELNRPVVAFPIKEYWMDIGQHQDYELAQRVINSWNDSK